MLTFKEYGGLDNSERLMKHDPYRVQYFLSSIYAKTTESEVLEILDQSEHYQKA
ncbi:MAG: hypothetical protein R6U96_12765 [Promethearchaeia archaeon]